MTDDNSRNIILEWILSHKAGVYFIAIGACIVAIGGFFDAVGKIEAFFENDSREQLIKVLSIDSNPQKTIYRKTEYDKNKEIMPVTFISHRLNTGQVCWETIDKCFSSYEEFSKYEQEVRINSNSEIFGFLENHKAEEISFIFEPKELPLSEDTVNQGLADPVLHVVINNPTAKPVTVMEISVIVHEIVEIKPIGITRFITETKDYVVPVKSKLGEYLHDENLLKPTLVLDVDDSIGVNVKLRPISAESPVGKYLVASLKIQSTVGEVNTDKFLVYFEDDDENLSPTISMDTCVSLTSKNGRGEIPNRNDREYIFECTGVVNFISALDELDRDLLFMKASYYPFERFKDFETQTESPIKYYNLIPSETLVSFFGVVDDYYGNQKK